MQAPSRKHSRYLPHVFLIVAATTLAQLTMPIRQLRLLARFAGAFYGASSIPSHWLERLHMRAEIASMANALHGVRAQGR